MFVKDTFTKIITSMSFVTMVLTPLIVIVVIIAIGYFASDFDSAAESIEIAVVSDDPSIARTLGESADNIHITSDILTVENAEEELAEEKIDGYLVAEWREDELDASLTYTSAVESSIPIIEQALSNNQILSRAGALGITPAELASLNEQVSLDTHIISVDEGVIVEEDSLERIIQIGSAYFINIVILMFIMFYATTVIEEVAGEKGTRMMEVILSSTTATTHFFGKIIGVFLVMLVHIALYLVIGVGAYLYVRNFAFVQELIGGLDVGEIVLNFLEFSSVFLIIGVVMFMFIAAFLGSLITKTEDINRAATPLSLITMLGFYIGLFAMNAPENGVVVISSYVPLLTPFVMPFRIATGTVPNLSVWLSIGGTILFTVLLAYISLLFYRANVLIYSDTGIFKTLKQSWNLVRSEN